jgi:hypothetical protein
MSTQAPTRTTSGGRWWILNEVRVPSGYTSPGKPYWVDGAQVPSQTKLVGVAPSVTKAVLLNLGQLDYSDKRQNWWSVERIAHDTQLSKESVKKAIAVLLQCGILKERVKRGWHRSSISILDWDLIETLRVPFRKADGDDIIPNPAVGGTTHDLVEMFLTFGPYKNKPGCEGIRLAVNKLLLSHEPGMIRAAWESLSDGQRAHVVNANNPVKYLLKTMSETISGKF